MRHLHLGQHRYVPKKFILETMQSNMPFHNIKHMVGKGYAGPQKKNDVGSMKPIGLGEGEGEGIRKHHKTIHPLRFRL
jgi:hypothetical protein